MTRSPRLPPSWGGPKEGYARATEGSARPSRRAVYDSDGDDQATADAEDQTIAKIASHAHSMQVRGQIPPLELSQLTVQRKPVRVGLKPSRCAAAAATQATQAKLLASEEMGGGARTTAMDKLQLPIGAAIFNPVARGPGHASAAPASSPTASSCATPGGQEVAGIFNEPVNIKEATQPPLVAVVDRVAAPLPVPAAADLSRVGSEARAPVLPQPGDDSDAAKGPAPCPSPPPSTRAHSSRAPSARAPSSRAHSSRACAPQESVCS